MSTETDDRKPHQVELYVILFASVLPSIVTWIYFVLLANQPSYLQASAGGIGKLIQFTLPPCWVFLICREPWVWPKFTNQGVALGLGFGALIGALMLGLSLGWLMPQGYFDRPSVAIREKIQGMGINSVVAYASLGVFYALCHSLLEEYYWRWFVFKRMSRFMSEPKAILFSSLGFMAHHVILLAVYFGWTSPITYLFSISVAIGGAFWAWLYQRSGSLLGPWLSHLLIDAAIFTIGFQIARDLFL